MAAGYGNPLHCLNGDICTFQLPQNTTTTTSTTTPWYWDPVFDIRANPVANLSTCVSDLCTDVGGNCCAPWNEQRSCSPGLRAGPDNAEYLVTPAYEVCDSAGYCERKGSSSYGMCEAVFGPTAIYQCCLPTTSTTTTTVIITTTTTTTRPPGFYLEQPVELSPLPPKHAPYDPSRLTSKQLALLTEVCDDNTFCHSDFANMFDLPKCRPLAYGEVGRVCWDETWTHDAYLRVASTHELKMVGERGAALERLAPSIAEEFVLPIGPGPQNSCDLNMTDANGTCLAAPLIEDEFASYLKAGNDSASLLAAYPNKSSWSDVAKLHDFTRAEQSIVLRSPPQCTWDCWKNNVVRGFKKCPRDLKRWSERPQCAEPSNAAGNNVPLLGGNGSNVSSGAVTPPGSGALVLSNGSNSSNASAVGPHCPVLNRTRDYTPDEICWVDEGDLEEVLTNEYELTVSRLRFRNTHWKPAALFKSLVTMGYDPCPVPGDYDRNWLDTDFTTPSELVAFEKEVEKWEEELSNLTNVTESFMLEHKVGRHAPPMINVTNCTALGLTLTDGRPLPTDVPVAVEYHFEPSGTLKDHIENARLWGGTLVTIEDEKENDVVKKLCILAPGSNQHTHTSNGCFIGLLRDMNYAWGAVTEWSDGTAYRHEWIDGIDKTYTNWRSKYPNSSPTMAGVARIQEDGQWHDIGYDMFDLTTASGAAIYKKVTYSCVNSTVWTPPLQVANAGPYCINHWYEDEFVEAANATIPVMHERYVDYAYENISMRVQLAYPEWAHSYDAVAMTIEDTHMTGYTNEDSCEWWAVGTDKTVDLPYVGPDNFTAHDFCPLFKEGCFGPMPEYSGPQ